MRATALECNPDKTEALAVSGSHNQGNRIQLILEGVTKSEVQCWELDKLTNPT